MLSLCCSLCQSISLERSKSSNLILKARRKHPRIRSIPWRSISSSSSSSSSSSMNEGDSSTPLDYDASGELLGLDADLQPRNVAPAASKLRSWFGPNGQYIRELPCPSCRGRGYIPCTECGVERSRSDCSQCSGKGIRTCMQCNGDCVIWEESIDERPWEKAQSSSPLKMKEDDEVDKLEIKVDVTRKSKRIYQSPSPEVSLKISRSLRSLNAKTGLFSKRMKIIHQDPVLYAQRVAAIKKAKGTDSARKQASELMKAFFSDPENRHKRSIAMKGAKFYCSHCGEEGHRKHYCSTLRRSLGKLQLRCRLCGEQGHNVRTCGKLRSNEEAKRRNQSSLFRCCKLCGQSGHNRRTCPQLTDMEGDRWSPWKSIGTWRIAFCPYIRRCYLLTPRNLELLLIVPPVVGDCSAVPASLLLVVPAGVSAGSLRLLLMLFTTTPSPPRPPPSVDPGPTPSTRLRFSFIISLFTIII